jgi:membrane-associated phospholipid phosphatase
VPDRLTAPLRQDVANLFNLRRLGPAVIGIGCSLVAHAWDRRLSGAPRTDKRTATFLRPAGIVGAFKTQTSVALGVHTAARFRGQRRVAEVAAEVVRAQLVSQATTEILKRTTRRERPDGRSRHSFPSGHSAAAFATATVVQAEFGWRFGVFAYAFAGWVAASRVQIQRHYLSDVVAGAAIGILGARAVVETERATNVLGRLKD